MRILALGKIAEADSAAGWAIYAEAEAKILWDWYGVGLLHGAFYCRDWSCVLLLVECSEERQAADYLRILPSVKAGLFSYEVTELVSLVALGEFFEKYRQPLPSWWAK